MIGNRPWGFFNLLHKDSSCWFKKIIVRPGEKLSLQRHKYRDEVWIILQGFARVNIGEWENTAGEGSVLRIPAGVLHRIENLDAKVDLIFTEVAFGNIVDEEDIERLQDCYGRAK